MLLTKKVMYMVLSYFIGSIPFAVLIPWALYKIDIREYGSANPGTTNVYRIISTKTSKKKAIMVTILVALLDVSKGIVLRLYTETMFINYLLAVLGHIYSPFLNFKGGKGVATYLGSFIGLSLNPIFAIPPCIWALLTFNKNWLEKFKLDQDWIEIIIIKIKGSFFVSLLVMSLSLLFLLLTQYSQKIKMSYFMVFMLICWHHIKYVKLI